MAELVSAVPAEILAARQASLQEWMAAEGLGAMVVFGQGSSAGTATRSHGNLRYLADWDSEPAPSALVLPRTGPPHLITASVFARLMAEDTRRFATAVLGKGAAFARAILHALGHAERVCITGRDEIPLGIWETLAAAGARDWLDCTAEFAKRRMVKDAVQISFHRRAAAICDSMFEALGPLAYSGRSAWQMQVALEALAKDRGAEYCKTWLTVAPAAGRCHFWRDENARIPQLGDQVLLGIMVLLNGHWGHALRTAHMGQPGEAARAMFATVERMYDGMFALMRPGAPLRDVNTPFDTEFRACMERLGDPEEFRFRSGHALGHSYEDPIGTAEFPQPYDAAPALPGPPLLLQPGMLFELHPNLFVPGIAGASIGDMVLIREDGPEVLTRFPRRLAVLTPQ
ncbi:M24 family metallopeptidase [Pararoseomonas indoligenes]|uniref:Aminopeptidase P family protein n=1 Tax=Roseomonas indoligenes TaxID=2820811 RepID=A0A940N494_9PROT|nr:M24 family metallopeptidase [Pararoseomonas indoligenes]MBP0495706.1 aminopeptidase P family protein [Pararoseomonas indoligenes]